MKGTAFGAGVGPGDPELMTLKTIKLIRENDVIAVPGTNAKESLAYRIAEGAVPEITGKELIALDMPMAKDRDLLKASHARAAHVIEEYLDAGKNVVYLTLGDPTVYCSFSYIQEILEADGYNVELSPGVTSFSASAARLGTPLTEWDEPLHILPSNHINEEALDLPGTCVLMKAGGRMPLVKQMLKDSGRAVMAVSNCGMENEQIYKGPDEIPDDAGYFSLIIAK